MFKQTYIYSTCKAVRDVASDPKEMLGDGLELEQMAHIVKGVIRDSVEDIGLYRELVSAGLKYATLNFKKFYDDLEMIQDILSRICGKSDDEFFPALKSLEWDHILTLMEQMGWSDPKQVMVYTAPYMRYFVPGDNNSFAFSECPTGAIVAYTADEDRVLQTVYGKTLPGTKLQRLAPHGVTLPLDSLNAMDIMVYTQASDLSEWLWKQWRQDYSDGGRGVTGSLRSMNLK